jgi:hypothetical protein
MMKKKNVCFRYGGFYRAFSYGGSVSAVVDSPCLHRSEREATGMSGFLSLSLSRYRRAAFGLEVMAAAPFGTWYRKLSYVVSGGDRAGDGGR